MGGIYRNAGKRLCDVTVSAIALILLSPLIVSIAVMVWIAMGRPIFFYQLRPGIFGHPFKMIKFRTMRLAKTGEIWFRNDQERLDWFGRMIRNLSLDELPSLWNVFCGEMSLVGPRPLLMEYLPKYSKEQNRRHAVLPGITGWAQVNGRQTILFSRRLELDVWYVDHYNFALDLRIIGMTVLGLLKPTGYIPDLKLDDVDDLGLAPDRELKNDESAKTTD